MAVAWSGQAAVYNIFTLLLTEFFTLAKLKAADN